MTNPAPALFYREAGSGPGVVCLHANASSSNQWRMLMEALAPRFHVMAADSLGAGRSPPWPSHQAVCLKDEVELLEPVFVRAHAPFVLVGHSYGAALALVAAVTRPQRIAALALFEPTLFALLDAASAPPNAADGIRATIASAGAALDAGDLGRAAEYFIDYWMGTGAWAATPAPRKDPILASIGHVRGWAEALLGEPTPLAAFAGLHVPVLYMLGKESPASSRAVAHLLIQVLPQVQVVEFEAMGHMGPITHPDLVNATIRRFLDGL